MTTNRRNVSYLNLLQGDKEQVLASHFIVLIIKRQNFLHILAAATPCFQEWLMTLVASYQPTVTHQAIYPDITTRHISF